MRLFAGTRQAVLPLRGSWVLSREVLDHALVAAAVDAGVTLVDGARAEIGTATDAARSVRLIGKNGTEVAEGRVVVDASGLGGPHADAEVAVDARSRIGVGAVVANSRYDLDAGELHMIVGQTGYVGVVRLEDGALDVGAALDVATVQRRGPAEAVADLLEGAGRPLLAGQLTRGWRGTPRLTRRHLRPAEERLLRVGDAAGYIEPFTGEGIGWALEGGLAVAAVATEGARAWQPRLERAWTSRQGDAAAARRLCAGLAWALRRPRLSRAAVTALAYAPALAGPFVRRAAASRTPVGAA
jgi:flavin-dependent dehydrogenase